jgi:hypothetical protein
MTAFLVKQICRPALAAIVLVLGACDAVRVVESSPTAVSVRYDGVMNGLDDATVQAGRACAAYNKTAKLRKVYYEGLGAGERYAHFDCI